MAVATYTKLIGFVYNPTNPKAGDFVQSLVDILGLQDRSWISTASDIELSPERLSGTSVVLTAGGDGTILRVARRVASYGIPILAINMGRVGWGVRWSALLRQNGGRLAIKATWRSTKQSTPEAIRGTHRKPSVQTA